MSTNYLPDSEQRDTRRNTIVANPSVTHEKVNTAPLAAPRDLRPNPVDWHHFRTDREVPDQVNPFTVPDVHMYPSGQL